MQKLKTGDASFGDEPGRAAAEWLSGLGKAGCFQEGFSSTRLRRRAGAVHLRQGRDVQHRTWELGNLATDALDAGVRDSVDYFTLPTIEGAVTDDNEYVTPSGIGMAVNAQTYDPLVRDFLAFALERYPEVYTASGALSPTSGVDPVIPDNATPAVRPRGRAVRRSGPRDRDAVGHAVDPATNTRLQQELTLLVQGDITPDEFIETMDASLKENVGD